MKPALLALLAVLSIPLAAQDVYQAAQARTGAPASILRGIAITESDERDGAIGDDGISVGRFQLNELYHGERARKYGAYDPFDAAQAAYIAGRLLIDNYRALGSWDAAIAAHNQGREGVRRNGIGWGYVERVRKGR